MRGCHRRSLPVNCREQFSECICEQADAVLDQPVGDRVERDADLVQGGESGTRPLDVLLEAEARPTVIPERIECRRQDSVDRFGADQLLYVEGVAVCRILRAGAGPE